MSFSNLPSRWFYTNFFDNSNDAIERAKLWQSLPSNYDASTRSIPLDIKENDQQFEIFADMPGVNQDELELTVEKNVLTIKGHRTEEKTEEDANQFVRTERISGKFQRSIHLPESADNEQVTANLENGVLRLSIPKKAAEQPRRIEVSTAA